jgi:hypothetical protein
MLRKAFGGSLQLLALSAVLAGCPEPGETGWIANKTGDLGDFAGDDDLIFIVGPGISAIDLEGAGQRTIFNRDVSVYDVAANGDFFVLGDHDTNLFVGDRRSGVSTQIPALNGRTQTAVISPDGRTVAASRHADFRQPQDTWSSSEDDTVYLIDTSTLSVAQIPPSTAGLVTRLQWTRDGQGLWIYSMAGKVQLVNVASGARIPLLGASADPFPIGPPVARTCPETGTIIEVTPGGLVLKQRDGQQTTVVIRNGFDPGVDSDGGAFHTVFFSRSCRSIVYDFQRSLWVADLASGLVARLAPGWQAFPDPTLWPR